MESGAKSDRFFVHAAYLSLIILKYKLLKTNDKIKPLLKPFIFFYNSNILTVKMLAQYIKSV